MTAHAYATNRRVAGQPRLFAIAGGAEAAGPVPPLTAAAQSAAAPRPFPVQVPSEPATRRATTLDAELRLVWTALSAGAPAACLLCGGRVEPHGHAAGGTCTDCGTTLE